MGGRQRSLFAAGRAPDGCGTAPQDRRTAPQDRRTAPQDRRRSAGRRETAVKNSMVKLVFWPHLASWELSWVILGLSCSSWGADGCREFDGEIGVLATFGLLGVVLGHIGPFLGFSWVYLASSWAILGLFGSFWRLSWVILGLSWHGLNTSRRLDGHGRARDVRGRARTEGNGFREFDCEIGVLATFGLLGNVFGHLGPVLGFSWVVLGRGRARTGPDGGKRLSRIRW